MIYLLDANTLIEAKNRYYGMTICPGYWSWILRSHGKGLLVSIETVGDELKRGKDELAQWAKHPTPLCSCPSRTPPSRRRLSKWPRMWHRKQPK